jgi:hypothetical protein
MRIGLHTAEASFQSKPAWSLRGYLRTKACLMSGTVSNAFPRQWRHWDVHSLARMWLLAPMSSCEYDRRLSEGNRREHPATGEAVHPQSTDFRPRAHGRDGELCVGGGAAR